VINGMTFDGAPHDPVQKAVRDALIGFMAATAQAQAEATKAAQEAGIAHAKATAAKTKYRGRKPSFTRETLEKVRAMLAVQTNSVTSIARETGLSRQPVYGIERDPAGQETGLGAWGG
jgi:putative DNA-invertase from lambdoid prophage Rac